MSLYTKIEWKLQTHVIRKIQRLYREKWWVRALTWWVRALTLLLILVVVVFLSAYITRKLTHIPWPVTIETPPSQFAPASAAFRRQELIIETPHLSTGSLLSYSGRRNEMLDVHCTSGQLTSDIFDRFRRQGADPLPPTNDERIYFVWQPPEGSAKPLPDDEDTCTASLSVALAPGSQPPTKIHFFQSYESGSDQRRVLEMMADAELIVNLNAVPPSGNPNDPGCARLLRVGKWELEHEQGMFQLKFLMRAGSKLTFIFSTFDGRSTLRGKEDFKPFDFGDQPLKAQMVSINPLADDKPVPSSSPISSARAAEGQSPLAIGNLIIGPEQVQLSVSGTGYVQTAGEYAGNFLEHASNSYQFLALVFTMINVAFVAWWLRRVARLFSRRPPDNAGGANTRS